MVGSGDPMVGSDDHGVRNAFLHRILDDRERGVMQSVETYQALFPGADAAIAAEYVAITAGPTAANVDGAGAGQYELRQIGPYKLCGKLGHGSFGLVYRAEDTRLRRTVALKVLARAGLESEREREQFEREAVIASRLDHPSICAVYEIARHGLWTCIAMRYVPGETLAARLAREAAHSLPTTDVLVLIEQVARALHAAHSAGVVHRDVKPANIMVTPAGEPVVVDFGLARDTQNGTGSLSARADWIGSPSYMAPEQVDPSLGPVAATTDVWALGVTLYECLAGQRPFEAPTQAALFDAILRREPVALRERAPQVSRDLAVVVATALAKEPPRRYQTAQNLADDLARVRRGEGVRARPLGGMTRFARWAQRNPAVASLLGAVFAVLVAGVAVATFLFTRAETNLQDWERLADGRRLEDLLRAADHDLWPAVPEKVPAMRAWLAAARDLTARLEDHRAALATLRQRAREVTARATGETEVTELAAIDEEEARLRQQLAALMQTPNADRRQAARQATAEARLAELAELRAALRPLEVDCTTFVFADPRAQLQHDKLVELVRGLERLAKPAEQRGDATIPSLVDRVAFAEGLEQRSVGDHAQAWAEALARIARNPALAGRQLSPVVGLVPLGADPASGLEEFADTATGLPPTRDAAGKLAIGESTALVFVLLPGGTFTMGSQSQDPDEPNYDPSPAADEGPPHAVTLAPFLLAKYEMTQGQWLRATGGNPSGFQPGPGINGLVADLRHPVEQVSWADCCQVLRRLGLQLPTEAQWEYACRAGTTTTWWCERDELPRCANLADASFRRTHPQASFTGDAGDDGYGKHAPVGMFRPNPFGLHDVHGNVWEWCADGYGTYDRPVRPGDGLRVVPGARFRIQRGGGFLIGSVNATCATRNRFNPTSRSVTLGVRPARPW